MTIFIVVPLSFMVAHLFMWCARREVQTQDTVWTTPLLYCCSYSAFVFVPVAAWFFYKYPAWSTSYARPEDMIRPWMSLGVVAIYFVSMIIGGIVAQSLLQLRRLSEFYFSGLLGLAWLLVTILITWNEYIYLGSYQEFYSGAARLIYDDPGFMQRLHLMIIALGVPCVFVLWNLWTRSRRLRWLNP